MRRGLKLFCLSDWNLYPFLRRCIYTYDINCKVYNYQNIYVPVFCVMDRSYQSNKTSIDHLGSIVETNVHQPKKSR